MGRSKNAQIAVELFNSLVDENKWDAETAWRAIATLLLTCELYQPVQGWVEFHGCIVFRDSNDFRLNAEGEPNEAILASRNLGAYLAKELGVSIQQLCATIGQYWMLPGIRPLQPHNPVGHAFRSMCVAYLQRFGDPSITYEEEVSPFTEFPGHSFPGSSPRAKIDIIARRGDRTVAIISSKWRFRHDRVEFIEEGYRYVTAARRHNPNCELYALTGEFSAARLHKALEASKPASPHGPLSATLHFAPNLIWHGLEENGRTRELRDLAWIAKESYKWV